MPCPERTDHPRNQANLINRMLDDKIRRGCRRGLILPPGRNRILDRQPAKQHHLAIAGHSAAAFRHDGRTSSPSPKSHDAERHGPLEVVSIRINGVEPHPGLNHDHDVEPHPARRPPAPTPGPSRRETVKVITVCGTFTASVEKAAVPESPVGNIVFNEIMFSAWSRNRNTWNCSIARPTLPSTFPAGL